MRICLAVHLGIIDWKSKGKVFLLYSIEVNSMERKGGPALQALFLSEINFYNFIFCPSENHQNHLRFSHSQAALRNNDQYSLQKENIILKPTPAHLT